MFSRAVGTWRRDASNPILLVTLRICLDRPPRRINKEHAWLALLVHVRSSNQTDTRTTTKYYNRRCLAWHGLSDHVESPIPRLSVGIKSGHNSSVILIGLQCVGPAEHGLEHGFGVARYSVMKYGVTLLQRFRFISKRLRTC
jgi:hypothetical protein